MQQRSIHKGSVTLSNRDSRRYACVNPTLQGLHTKPQDHQSLAKRKQHWANRVAKALRKEK